MGGWNPPFLIRPWVKPVTHLGIGENRQPGAPASTTTIFFSDVKSPKI